MHESARMHIYNNVYTKNRHAKVFINVKYIQKKQLFYEKIWWNEKQLVLLHSLLRNQALLKAIKKEFFERFYINRQVVQEAVNFLEIRKLTG